MPVEFSQLLVPIISLSIILLAGLKLHSTLNKYERKLYLGRCAYSVFLVLMIPAVIWINADRSWFGISNGLRLQIFLHTVVVSVAVAAITSALFPVWHRWRLQLAGANLALAVFLLGIFVGLRNWAESEVFDFGMMWFVCALCALTGQMIHVLRAKSAPDRSGRIPEFLSSGS